MSKRGESRSFSMLTGAAPVGEAVYLSRVDLKGAKRPSLSQLLSCPPVRCALLDGGVFDLHHRFAIRYSITPSPELREKPPQVFDGSLGATLSIRNVVAEGGQAAEVNSGLEVDLELDAESIDDAIWKGSAIITMFVAEISLASAARCGMPREVIVVQLTSESGTHAFREYALVQGEVARRYVRAEVIRGIREAIWRVEPDSQECVWRGIQAFQQALSTLDALVEVMILWVAVETMNVPLGRRRGIPRPKALEGTLAYFSTRGAEGKALFRKAKKLRNDWLHGSTDMADLGTRAREILEPMQLAARDAVASCIDLHWTGDRRPIKHWPVQFMLETTLSAPEGEPLGIGGDLPSLGLRFAGSKPFTRRGDEILASYEFTTQSKLGPNVSHPGKAKVGIIGEQVRLVKFPKGQPE